MGFPAEEAAWSAIEGASFMGANGSMPGIWSVIAIAACILVLVIGQGYESRKYKT